MTGGWQITAAVSAQNQPRVIVNPSLAPRSQANATPWLIVPIFSENWYEEAIVAWTAPAEHQPAQEAGKSTWYADYQLRIAKVERAYGKTE
jgi:heme-degrading monooxygenase HmoA